MIIKIADNHDGLTLKKALADLMPSMPINLLQKLCRKGAVRMNGKRCQPQHMVHVGDEIKCPEIENHDLTIEKQMVPVDLGLFQSWILHEDKSYLFINKPQGLAVQGGSGIKVSIDDYLKAYSNRFNLDMKTVHRLDRQTSGVLMLAKHASAAKKAALWFKESNVEKSYVAILNGEIESDSGMIDLPLSKEMVGTQERVITSDAGAFAETRYKMLAVKDGLSLVQLFPITGRTHQLRAHCWYGLGLPILGDGKYGGQDAYINDRRCDVYLHALNLKVPEAEIDVSSPWPELFSSYFSKPKSF